MTEATGEQPMPRRRLRLRCPACASDSATDERIASSIFFKSSLAPERVPVISAALIVMLAALAGWLAGLTAHAFRAIRWRDPGARLAWGFAAAIAAGGMLLATLALCLLTLRPVFLLAIPASLTLGALGAWRASELLRRPGSDAAGRNGRLALGGANVSAVGRWRVIRLALGRRSGSPPARRG